MSNEAWIHQVRNDVFMVIFEKWYQEEDDGSFSLAYCVVFSLRNYQVVY